MVVRGKGLKMKGISDSVRQKKCISEKRQLITILFKGFKKTAVWTTRPGISNGTRLGIYFDFMVTLQ